jgi:hypothetical protein
MCGHACQQLLSAHTNFCSSTKVKHLSGTVTAEACCCYIRQEQATPNVLTNHTVLLAALTTQFFTAITAQTRILLLVHTYCRIQPNHVPQPENKESSS